MKTDETKTDPNPTAATILVVDDNPINLKLVSDLLMFEGYRVLKAEDGEEAAAIVEKAVIRNNPTASASDGQCTGSGGGL